MTETIRLEKHGSKIRLFTAWAPDVPEACKSVAGAEWNAKQKCWEYPLQWPVCLELRKYVANVLGRDFRFSKDMWEWANAEKARYAAIPDPSSYELVDLPRVRERNPKMWEALSSRPFQTVGVKFGAETGQLILADDPGLGKTVQTLAVMEEANVTGPILVVANKSAQEVTWPAQIEQWTDDDYLVFNTQIPKNQREAAIQEVFDDCKADPTLRIWVIVNPYWIRMKAEVDEYGKYVRSTTGVKIISVNVRSFFDQGPWSAIIADESQETLACNTGNAKKWSQQRQGMGALPLADDGIKISISGTPMRGKPENMFGQLTWIAPTQYTSYWKWAKRHFKVTDDGYQGAMEVGELISEKAFYEECSQFMLRRSKSDVAKDLPPKMYGGSHWDPKDTNTLIGVWLPMKGEQKKLYDSFVKNGSLTANGMELNAVGILAETTRMKQLATSCGDLETELKPIYETGEDGERRIVRDDDGTAMMQEVVTLRPRLESNKFDWLLEWLQERDLVGPTAKGKGKVIIASQFRKVIELFRKELGERYGTPSFEITGSTSTKNRVAYQEEFQSNPDSPKIFFIQTKAGGTSLTLDQADDVIILDEMWNPDNQEQVEDRAHRLSNTEHHVTIWYVRSRETIEEDIGVTLEERLNTCKGIMDGQRGVDFAKKLLQKHNERK